MVCHSPHGRFGHRVDRVRRDQLLDVHGVAVRRVLGAGRCPQRPLQPGTTVGQRLPARRREVLLEQLVGEPRVGDSRLTPQFLRLGRADLVQPAIDLGVDPAHEERGHRGERGDVNVVGRLEPGHEGIHDFLIALQREDQRHVHADALGQAGLNRRQALPRRRDLDEQVGPVDHPPQRPRLCDRLGRLFRQPWIDLDRHPAVHALRGVVDGPEHVACPSDVVRRQGPRCLLNADPPYRQVAKLLVVGAAMLHGVREDRRVRRDTPDMEVPDQHRQVPRGEPLPADVVEPDRHVLGDELGEHVLLFLLCCHF